MKRFVLMIVAVSACIRLFGQDLRSLESRRVRLPNGWSLTPAGTSLPLGDLPLNISVSASKRLAAVTNNGQSTQTIQLIDARADKLLDSIIIPKSWGGLAFGADEKSLYASGGNDNRIIQYAIRNNRLQQVDSFVLGAPWPNRISVAGITLDDARGLLYAVTKENNSLYIVDLHSHNIVKQLSIGGEGYTCLLSPDRKALYISVWGAEKVLVLDTDKMEIIRSIPVGSHPNDLCLSSNGKVLYVANANDNTVSVVDTHTGNVLETLNAAIYPGSLIGSTTNGVALSADEHTLYVANADNNCLAVFDVSKPGAAVSGGFIPTGWYPTCVRTIGKKLYVANGKGFSSFPNPDGPNPAGKGQSVSLHLGDAVKPRKVQYIGGGLMMGTMSIIPAPSQKLLAVYTQAVLNNTPYHKDSELATEGQQGNPVPHKVGDPSPVKHVFYIIKENRTYDQVLSDIKEGNGDTSLLLFGERITPNQHAIAKEFVLLDNFYVDGEVSSDGHNWSMGAYATDYLEKNWPTSYGRRGGTEISSGHHPLGNTKNGYIWDQANRYDVSFRTYGEFADGGTPNIPVLKDHVSPTFASLNQRIRDTVRANQWIREFDSLVNANAVPQLNTIRLANDHTQGTAAGAPTPFAHVADNDLAVGMIVEHLSKSPLWKESVVFIVEDDAQNGPDHVDAHRTTAYIAGGYIKRGFTDHTMYSTSSMLRTMELILGLPPMTQFDAAATPMWRCFSNEPNMAAFTSRPCNVNLDDKNPANTRLAALSKGLNFSEVDIIPDEIMNTIVWKAVKGIDSPVPPPTRAAFFKPFKHDDDEDDD